MTLIVVDYRIVQNRERLGMMSLISPLTRVLKKNKGNDFRGGLEVVNKMSIGIMKTVIFKIFFIMVIILEVSDIILEEIGDILKIIV